MVGKLRSKCWKIVHLLLPSAGITSVSRDHRYHAVLPNLFQNQVRSMSSQRTLQYKAPSCACRFTTAETNLLTNKGGFIVAQLAVRPDTVLLLTARASYSLQSACSRPIASLEAQSSTASAAPSVASTNLTLAAEVFGLAFGHPKIARVSPTAQTSGRKLACNSTEARHIALVGIALA